MGAKCTVCVDVASGVCDPVVAHPISVYPAVAPPGQETSQPKAEAKPQGTSCSAAVLDVPEGNVPTLTPALVDVYQLSARVRRSSAPASARSSIVGGGSSPSTSARKRSSTGKRWAHKGDEILSPSQQNSKNPQDPGSWPSSPYASASGSPDAVLIRSGQELTAAIRPAEPGTPLQELAPVVSERAAVSSETPLQAVPEAHLGPLSLGTCDEKPNTDNLQAAPPCVPQKRPRPFGLGTLDDTESEPCAALAPAASEDPAPSKADQMPSRSLPRLASKTIVETIEEEPTAGLQHSVLRDRPFSLASLDEMDDAFVSRTWSLDTTALRHNPSGLHISCDGGVRVDGQTYMLSPEDIEVDDNVALGAGAGGVVHAGVIKPTGVNVAIKTVRVDSKEKREQMLSEIKGLIQAAGCPYVVEWYAGFLTANTSLVLVVLEYMDLGSLADLRQRLGPCCPVPADPYLACIAAQTMGGLCHSQKNKLLHRDIKPHNVLHNRQGRVKLTDFGISKDLGGPLSGGVGTTFVGTSAYMSPERLEGEEHSYNSDVWSAGVVIYELAVGRQPFQANSFLDVYSNICEGPEPRLTQRDEYPEALRDLVAQCLTRDAAQRPDALALAEHPIGGFCGEAYAGELGRWLVSMEAAREKSDCGDY